MNRFEFYKELYYKEIERQEFVNSSMNSILSILSGLVVGIFILATTFSYESNLFSSYLFLATIVLALIPISISVSFLSIAFVNKRGMFRFGGAYEYKYLALTSDILAWQKNLDRYFASSPEDINSGKNLSDKEFESQLIEQLTQFTDINIKSNDDKSANIYNAKKFLIYSIIVSFLTVFPYGYALYNKPRTVYKLNLSEKESKKIRKVVKQSSTFIMPESPKSIPSVPTLPEVNRPPVPPPPPGRLIKEGERPPKTKND